MITFHSVVAAGVLASCVAPTLSAQNHDRSPQFLHTRTPFRFTVKAPLEQVAPLFGANEERKWAPGWNPAFVYPNPAHDEQGMVFQVAHGPYTSTWVNTVFDLTGGHIQYAYVLSDAMVTTIDIRLTRASALITDIAVVYERTALTPEANDHVQHFAAADAKAAQEWQEQINAYLSSQSPKP
jgi:hypothetical protein